MKANNLNIRHFVNDPEAMERELLLKFFRFEGNRANVLQLEHIPAVLTAGCVVLCLKGGLSLKLNEGACRADGKNDIGDGSLVCGIAHLDARPLRADLRRDKTRRVQTSFGGRGAKRTL